jgi:ornithine carbamoyltransferase
MASPSKQIMTTLYEQDFYLRIEETAHSLRRHAFEALDINHLTEEAEAMSRRKKRELRSPSLFCLAPSERVILFLPASTRYRFSA